VSRRRSTARERVDPDECAIRGVKNVEANKIEWKGGGIG
jgi:hypothetical protein